MITNIAKTAGGWFGPEYVMDGGRKVVWTPKSYGLTDPQVETINARLTDSKSFINIRQ